MPGEEPSPPTRSRAVILLAALGRATPSLSLSAAECARLAPLVDEWFARGAGEETIRTTLTAGLPSPIHSPAALLQRRLTDKLPPIPVTPVAPLRMLECSECGAPGAPEALPGGMCRACGDVPPTPAGSPHAHKIHARANAIRKAMASHRAKA